MSTAEAVAILRDGVEKWNAWCRDRKLSSAELFGSSSQPHDYYWVDLSEADLRGAVLPGAHLVGVNLRGANLRGANLAKAKIQQSNLEDCSLRGAELPAATVVDSHLNRADLTGADLTDADLQGADLQGAIVRRSKLQGTNFTATLFGDTVLADVDLSAAKGLWSIRHKSPSTIGLDTILRSRRGTNVSAAFLQQFGIPETLATQLASPENIGKIYHSIFISHSNEDREFAERVHGDLKQAGLKELFLAISDLRAGDLFANSIAASIKSHDKLLVVLSRSSLQSTWVAQEVRMAVEKETLNTKVVLPVRIDDAVLQTDQEWAKSLRETRQIADFSTWKAADSYERSLIKLLSELNKLMDDSGTKSASS